MKPAYAGRTTLPPTRHNRRALAVAVFKLSVERALLAATLGGAYSISRSDRGVVAAHKLADLVLWEAEHEGAFAWAYGLKPRVVWLRGTQVFA